MNKSRKMSKHLIILAISVLLICVTLSGCVGERGKFIGKGKKERKPFVLFEKCQDSLRNVDLG